MRKYQGASEQESMLALWPCALPDHSGLAARMGFRGGIAVCSSGRMDTGMRKEGAASPPQA